VPGDEGEDSGRIARASTFIWRANVTKPIAGKGRNSGLVKLLCECFAGELAKRGTPVDGVFHGTFGGGDLQPGKLTVGDCWRIIPYENMLAVAEVTPDDLAVIIAEDRKVRDSNRTLWPFEVTVEPGGKVTRIALEGQELAPDRRLRIAFNSYGAQSGGRRLMRMREILAAPESRRSTTPVDTRGALIAGLLNRGTVG
jgi:2',3'-cyclic-nucleotide 2'-phosphodiesterase (5'-nucleotidase family)